MSTQPLDLSINAVCPYFTMFPLEFPLQILNGRAQAGHRVLDPFCGRGTTNLAARVMGLYSVGVDASPVATAIAAAKLVRVTPESVVSTAKKILDGIDDVEIPHGDFWRRAFAPSVLKDICKLRQALVQKAPSPNKVALRALVLGALHGPQHNVPSYFSNQSPRTFSPKPRYAVNYWKQHKMRPQRMDTLALIKRRAERYYKYNLRPMGEIRTADSRVKDTFVSDTGRKKYDWIITSPPYYGMRTYLPDQWIRNWFVGGPDFVDYSEVGQVLHRSPETFARELASVWKNVRAASKDSARMIIRFGGIPDRSANPLEIIKSSFEGTGWKLQTIRSAGDAPKGRRQAESFLKNCRSAVGEYDLWASAM